MKPGIRDQDTAPVSLTVTIQTNSRPAPSSKVRPVLKSSGKTSLMVSWTKMKNVDGYGVFIARCNTEKYRLVKSVPANKESYEITGLKEGTSYVAVRRESLEDMAHLDN